NQQDAQQVPSHISSADQGRGGHGGLTIIADKLTAGGGSHAVWVPDDPPSRAVFPTAPSPRGPSTGVASHSHYAKRKVSIVCGRDAGGPDRDNRAVSAERQRI